MSTTASESIAARFGALARHAITDTPTRSGDIDLDREAIATMLGLDDQPGALVATVRLEGHAARFATPRTVLPPRLSRLLAENPGRLYTHQVAVTDHALAGRHVVLATPTASGKSLAFLVPALAHLERDPRSTVLALYPTKALAHDQLARLVEFERALGIDVGPAVYDGDTPAPERARIKDRSRLVVTNPHGLNLYLGWHEGWERILANLALVIVDETHAYTGATGGAVGWLLRRLRRLAAAHGATPVFVGASGTIANPAEHFARLIGDDVVLVDEDGSAQPTRTIAIVDATRSPDHAPIAQSALLVRRLVRHRRHVIAFSNSRAHAELLARLATDRAVRVEPYRAGYAAQRRRALEADLRAGRLRAISATSALELGIDVGVIDTVVLNGFPGSIASLFQRIGRAGRSGQDALGVVVLGAEPAARALIADPEEFLLRPPELAVANVDQPSVVRRALELAASERPVTHDELRRWGALAHEAADALVEAGTIRRDPDGLRVPGRRPHRFRPLVEMEPTWRLQFEGTRSPIAPETLSESQALRETYRGAIVLHGSQPYRVVRVDHAARVAVARPEPDRGHHTQAAWFRAIAPTRIRSHEIAGSLTLDLADAVLVEQVTSAKEFRGSVLVHQRKVSAPSRSVVGEALILSTNQLVASEEVPALHGVEHLLVKALAPLAVGASDLTTLTQATPAPQILFFAPDTLGGGTMLGAVARQLDRALAIAERILTRCGCADGCPFCSLDARCDGEVASKSDVHDVLERLRDHEARRS